MSAIITRINMPDGCNSSCPCRDAESGFCEAAYIIYGDYKHINENYDIRAKNCPLKSVEGLIEKLELESNKAIGYPNFEYSKGLRKAIEIIKEYCEVSEDKMENKLKPCPFCKNEAQIKIIKNRITDYHTVVKIGCSNSHCFCRISENLGCAPHEEYIDNTIKSMKEKWNRRAES